MIRLSALVALAGLCLSSACSTDTTGLNAGRLYGTPVKVGDGNARTYVVLDATSRAPQEIGIALDEKALDNLPSTEMMYPYILNFPALSPAPYQFAELDWNPQGHVPPGVYTFPHFDFHFYTIPVEQRDAITPSDPNFATKARNVPTGDFVPPYYIVPGDPAQIAVPQMGVHWADTRSPELQGILGHPENYQQFTKTFIYGSWDGQFTFLEPMVTRDFLLTHPDDVQEIPVPAQYPQAGYYPTQYRVTYDPQAKEYRIALTGLVSRS
ncbi:MAG TPA: hypothetical protein VJ852_10720 [Gemmatimonadaceae bacterium]|nr:hypothetical protein [Gemmatimonadaceae bacterium]